MKKARSMSDGREQAMSIDAWSPSQPGLQSSDGRLSPSAGALLRSAREAAGLHIAALAVALKVPVKKLEALEQDRVDLLPDITFARALTASVCRNLKIDPSPMLERLPKSGSSQLSVKVQRAKPVFESGDSQTSRGTFATISRPALISGLVLICGSLFIVFLPDIRYAVAVVQEKAEFYFAATSNDNAPIRLGSTNTPPVLPEVLAKDVAKEPENARPAPALVVEADEKSLAVADSQTSNSKSSGSILTLTASRESWVKVTDAKGIVVLRRLLSAGEVAAVAGALPLEAVVGRADVTRVEIRGKAVDLAPVTRDNVARFEVK
jgi:cytoskeleton protein RodZ